MANSLSEIEQKVALDTVLPVDISAGKSKKPADKIKISSYPKVSIITTKTSEPSGIKIVLSTQTSAEEPPSIQEKFLLNTNINTNGSANDNPNSKDEKGERLSFSLPGQAELECSVLPDGSIIVEKADTQGSFSFTSSRKLLSTTKIVAREALFSAEDVVLQAPLEVNTLSLKANGLSISKDSGIQCHNASIITRKEFYNHGIVEVKDTLKIVAKGKVENHHTLRGIKNFKLKGLNINNVEQNAELINSGLIHGEETLINAKSLDNSGYILSKHCRTHLGYEHPTSAQVVLKNSGQILSQTRLSLGANGKIQNENTGFIGRKNILNKATDNDEQAKFTLNIYGPKKDNQGVRLENKGRIEAGLLWLQAREYAKNLKEGKIITDELKMDGPEGGFKNDGELFVNRQDCLIHSKLFENNGKIFCKGKFLGTLFKVKNRGLLVSKDSIEIYTQDKQVNSKNGKMLCDGYIILKALGKMKFNGQMQTMAGDIDTASGKNTSIGALGHLNSGNNLLVSSENCHNLGLLQCQKDAYIKTLDQFHNDQKARVEAQGCINIESHSVKNDGQLKSHSSFQATVASTFEQSNNGSLHSLLDISLKIQGILHNAGSMRAENHLDIWAKSAITNSGRLEARTASLKTEHLLNNLLQGIIFAAKDLKVSSNQVLNNAGKMMGLGQVTAESGSLLKNLPEGEICSAGDVKALAGSILSNAGKIFGENSVTAKAAGWLENMLTGDITSKGFLNLQSQRIDNYGTLEGETKLYLEAFDIIHNHANGKINSSLALEQLSHCFTNEGEMTSEGSLKLEVAHILDNAGRIAAEDVIHLVNACLISNSGKIEGHKDVSLHTSSLLYNREEGSIEAKNALEMMIGYTVANAGIIAAERVHIAAKSLLENSLTGRIGSKTETSLSSDGFMLNRGQYQSDGDIKARAEYILNCSQGKITARETVELLAKQHLLQQGRIAAKRGIIEACTLIQSGSIITLQDLAIKIKNLFNHCKEGSITAGETVTVLTQNLYLAGQLMGEGKFTFEVNDSFEYDSETVWACDILKLMLKQGYDFTKPLKTAGSLELETPLDFNIHTQIETGQDASLKAQKVLIEKNPKTPEQNSGISAGGILSIKTNDSIQVGNPVHDAAWIDNLKSRASFKRKWASFQLPKFSSDGSYLKSESGMHLKSNLIHNALGDIYTNGDLWLEALSRIENQGHITAHGNAKFIAPLFNNKLMTFTSESYAEALSAPASVSIDKNCVMLGHLYNLGSSFMVGGKYFQQGNFESKPFESYRKWTEEHTSETKGRRKNGGLSRSRKTHTITQYIPRHDTLKVYPAVFSAGGGVDIRGTDPSKGAIFYNGGQFYTTNCRIEFEKFFNKSDIPNHEALFHATNANLIGNCPVEFEKIYNRSSTPSYKAIFYAMGAKLIEKPRGATLYNSGIMHIVDMLHMQNCSLVNEQRKTTVYQKVQPNERTTPIYVATEEPAKENPGVIEAGRFTANLHHFHQIGGMTKTGQEGTHWTVRDGVVIEALHCLDAVQRDLTRRGQNYEIVPRLEPAYVLSKGSQFIDITGSDFARGDFIGQGMTFLSGGVSSIDARGDILMPTAKQAYEKARYERRSGFGGSKHQTLEETGHAVLQTCFHGGEGVRLISREGRIKLPGALLSSGGDATLRAKEPVQIVNDTVTDTINTSDSRFRGFKYQQSDTEISQEKVIPPSVFVRGNLDISSDVEVHLKSVKATVQGDMSLRAPNVVIEEAVEKTIVTTETESLSLSFFGSNALEKACRGEEATKVLGALLKEDRFCSAVDELVNAKDNGARTNAAFNLLIQGWKFGADAANAYMKKGPDGTQGDVFGSLTDRYKMTTSSRDKDGNVIDRNFNPQFKLTYTGTSTTDTSTRTIRSVLSIGGNFRVVSDTTKVSGSDISASNMDIEARKSLEIRAGKDTQDVEYSESSRSGSFTLNSFVEGGVGEAHSSNYKERYHNTGLTARGHINIVTQKSSISGANLKACDITIEASEATIESLQDREIGSGDNSHLCLGKNTFGMGLSDNYSEYAKVKKPTSIQAERTLTVRSDSLTQTGSILSAGQNLSVRGLRSERPKNWSRNDLQDIESSKSQSFQFGVNRGDSFPVTGSIYNSRKKEIGVTRSVVSAPDVQAALPQGMHRDLNTAQEILDKKSSSLGLPFFLFNKDKLEADRKVMGDFVRELRPAPKEPHLNNHFELNNVGDFLDVPSSPAVPPNSPESPENGDKVVSEKEKYKAHFELLFNIMYEHAVEKAIIEDKEADTWLRELLYNVLKDYINQREAEAEARNKTKSSLKHDASLKDDTQGSHKKNDWFAFITRNIGSLAAQGLIYSKWEEILRTNALKNVNIMLHPSDFSLMKAASVNSAISFNDNEFYMKKAVDGALFDAMIEEVKLQFKMLRHMSTPIGKSSLPPSGALNMWNHSEVVHYVFQEKNYMKAVDLYADIFAFTLHCDPQTLKRLTYFHGGFGITAATTIAYQISISPNKVEEGEHQAALLGGGFLGGYGAGALANKACSFATKSFSKAAKTCSAFKGRSFPVCMAGTFVATVLGSVVGVESTQWLWNKTKPNGENSNNLSEENLSPNESHEQNEEEVSSEVLSFRTTFSSEKAFNTKQPVENTPILFASFDTSKVFDVPFENRNDSEQQNYLENNVEGESEYYKEFLKAFVSKYEDAPYNARLEREEISRTLGENYINNATKAAEAKLQKELEQNLDLWSRTQEDLFPYGIKLGLILGPIKGFMNFIVDIPMAVFKISADAEKLIDNPKHLKRRENQIQDLKFLVEKEMQLLSRKPMERSAEILGSAWDQVKFHFNRRLSSIGDHLREDNRFTAGTEVGEPIGDAAALMLIPGKAAYSAGKAAGKTLIFSVKNKIKPMEGIPPYCRPREKSLLGMSQLPCFSDDFIGKAFISGINKVSSSLKTSYLKSFDLFKSSYSASDSAGKVFMFTPKSSYPLFKDRTLWLERFLYGPHKPPEKIELIRSVEDVRKYKNCDLTYVITKDGELRITSTKCDHHDLSHREPVLCAGFIYTDSFGRVKLIDNDAPIFNPRGEHLKGLLKSTLIKYGFKEKEIRNKYEAVFDVKRSKFERILFMLEGDDPCIYPLFKTTGHFWETYALKHKKIEPLNQCLRTKMCRDSILNYVITRARELIIARDEHWRLSKGEPVLCAGQVKVGSDGYIKEVNSWSKDYKKIKGEHLEDLITTIFSLNGFPDAIGKYKPFISNESSKVITIFPGGKKK